jgi:hypothetical protein
MKEAFEKMTGMPDAWTNPALMVSRNAFIQGWEAALAQPAQQERVQTDSLADIGAAYKDIHACLTETLQLSRKQNGHPRQPAHVISEQEQWKNWIAMTNRLRAKREYEPDAAQPAQEPVAWRVKWPAIGGGHKWLMVDKPLLVKDGFVNEALYTTPQQRTWVGLTFAEICDAEVVATDGFNNFSEVKFARAIEAKLKELNT